MATDKKVVLELLEKLGCSFTKSINTERAERKIMRALSDKGVPKDLTEEQVQLVEKLLKNQSEIPADEMPKNEAEETEQEEAEEETEAEDEVDSEDDTEVEDEAVEEKPKNEKKAKKEKAAPTEKKKRNKMIWPVAMTRAILARKKATKKEICEKAREIYQSGGGTSGIDKVRCHQVFFAHCVAVLKDLNMVEEVDGCIVKK